MRNGLVTYDVVFKHYDFDNIRITISVYVEQKEVWADEVYTARVKATNELRDAFKAEAIGNHLDYQLVSTRRKYGNA